ncbi:MAG: aldehyde dehydrogenase family protein, partial [bacterium]
DSFKYYIKHVPKLLRKQKISPMNPLFKLRKGFVQYEPLGIVAVISPWNFPFLLAMQHIVPAILTGNTVIHKPSELTTLTGLKIREIFNRAYLPQNVLSVVTGLADVGQALVRSKIDKIMFTGSTEIGKKIYQSAAERLVPVNLELGGSDPMIVLEDADIERAVNAAIWGAFSNAGQACLSVERLLIHETILDVFVQRFVEKAAKLRPSQNGAADGDISCLINERQLHKHSRLLKDACEKGAVISLGGKKRDDIGELYLEPTLLTNVNSGMEVAKQEIFGPLITATPFISDDEAVFLANASEFGLSASIWTRNTKRGLRLANDIEAGSVLINDVQFHIAQTEAPYTGFKNSGIGVSHGPWGVMELVQPKYINMDRPFLKAILGLISKDLSRNNLWWYQYSEELVKDLRIFCEFLYSGSQWKKIKKIPATLRAIFRSDYL